MLARPATVALVTRSEASSRSDTLQPTYNRTAARPISVASSGVSCVSKLCAVADRAVHSTDRTSRKVSVE